MQLQNALKLGFVLFALIALSCSGKKEQDHTHSEADQREWKEMDDFHIIMAETFHPYKDSSDLQPVKSRANELVAAADKWSNASLPDKVNDEEMKEKLQQLKSETEALEDVVQTGTDQAIGEQLTKVHDLFHGIQEQWYGGHGHGHEHGHDH